MKKKWFLSVFLTLFLLLPLFVCGCSQENENHDFLGTPDNPVTLRVLVDKNQTQEFDRLTFIVRNRFEEKFENAEIVFEELPGDMSYDAWDVYRAQLMTEIMAGKGPDIYLLPTAAGMNLFPNVNQTMRNGLFFDFSDYYDADAELDKENLVAAVMDAGVVGKARYALPLRYDFGVAYADRNQLAAAGLTAEELFASGPTGMMDAVSRAELQVAGTGSTFQRTLLNCLPRAVDYDREKLLLTQTDVVDFLTSYRDYADCEVLDFWDSHSYYTDGMWWPLSGGYTRYYGDTIEPGEGPCCMKVETLEAVFQQYRVAKSENLDLVMIPMTNPAGEVVADVTFYGAVSAECQYPKLAYEFLRLFLAEDIQWETAVHYQSMVTFSAEGLPVRTKGFPEAMNQNISRLHKNAIVEDEAELARRRALEAVEFTESDMPILQIPIDRVEFPIQAEEDLVFLLDKVTAETTDGEIEDIAQQWLRDLEFHLSES